MQTLRQTRENERGELTFISSNSSAVAYGLWHHKILNWNNNKKTDHKNLIGEQGWCSGESARLPPMWPKFDSRTRRHMRVEFVVGSRPRSERFFSGFSGFPLSSKINISKFQFDLESVPLL